MSLTYGFYNSLNGDRKYDAVQLSSMFDGLIIDGVFASIGTCFVVKADNGYSITVGIGKAWFNHTWTFNDSIMPITAPISEVLLDRIDAVVLEVNTKETERINSIKLLKGEPSSSPKKPVLIKEDGVFQYPLCYINRPAGSSVINQSDIKNMVGTNETPFVVGILKTIDINELLLKWGDQFDRVISFEEKEFKDWFRQKMQEFNQWSSTEQNKFIEWSNTEQKNFIDWFNNIKSELTGDVAANLQLQISEIKTNMPNKIDQSDIINICGGTA